MGTVLEARGLVVRRGQQTVLHGADLVLESGTCTLLLGENGTGKSTFMETVLGLHPLEAGQVHVMGKVVRDAEGRRARRPHAPLGVLLQSDGSIRDQSVRHHLAVCATAAGVLASDDDVATLADRMGLRHRLDEGHDDLVQARRGVSLVALEELDEHLASEAADGAYLLVARLSSVLGMSRLLNGGAGIFGALISAR